MQIDIKKISYIVPLLNRYEIEDKNKFWDWWNNFFIPIKRLQKDSRGNGGGFNGEFWDGITVFKKPEYQHNIVWKVNYQPNDELFKEINERIIKELPWFDVIGITLWSNKIEIPYHQDGRPRDPFPSAPRIMLLDECENRTFYLKNKENNNLIFPDLRKKSNLFFFNNEKFFHGALTPINGKKILIRIDGNLIDPDGLKKYIKNEIKKGALYE